VAQMASDLSTSASPVAVSACAGACGISNLTLTLHGAAAALLEILRQAVDTRKTALVEVALDLIQRLIAHQALQVVLHWGANLPNVADAMGVSCPGKMVSSKSMMQHSEFGD